MAAVSPCFRHLNALPSSGSSTHGLQQPNSAGRPPARSSCVTCRRVEADSPVQTAQYRAALVGYSDLLAFINPPAYLQAARQYGGQRPAEL